MPRPRPRSVALILLVWFAAGCATAPWNPASAPLLMGSDVEVRWQREVELWLSLSDSSWSVLRPSSATGTVAAMGDGRLFLRVLRLSAEAGRWSYYEPGPIAVVPLEDVRVYPPSEPLENQLLKVGAGLAGALLVWIVISEARAGS